LSGDAVVYTLGGMCQRATCPTCDRPTFAGCGMHVEQVLADVPTAQRCQCGASAPAGGSLFRRLWGR
jgi:hypothetical protein